MEAKLIFESLKQTNEYRIFVIPFALMLVDFVTGIFHAWSTGHLKSYKMREGLNRKVAELSILIIGYLFTWTLGLPKYIIAALTFYIIIMELVSICENLDKMGVKIPKFVQKALKNAEYKIQNEDLKSEAGEKDGTNE